MIEASNVTGNIFENIILTHEFMVDLSYIHLQCFKKLSHLNFYSPKSDVQILFGPTPDVFTRERPLGGLRDKYT